MRKIRVQILSINTNKGRKGEWEVVDAERCLDAALERREAGDTDIGLDADGCTWLCEATQTVEQAMDRPTNELFSNDMSFRREVQRGCQERAWRDGVRVELVSCEGYVIDTYEPRPALPAA